MPFTVGGWTGDVKSEKGGASLKFEGRYLKKKIDLGAFKISEMQKFHNDTNISVLSHRASG